MFSDLRQIGQRACLPNEGASRWAYILSSFAWDRGLFDRHQVDTEAFIRTDLCEVYRSMVAIGETDTERGGAGGGVGLGEIVPPVTLSEVAK